VARLERYALHGKQCTLKRRIRLGIDGVILEFGGLSKGVLAPLLQFTATPRIASALIGQNDLPEMLSAMPTPLPHQL
jgi:hypothetical protein